MSPLTVAKPAAPAVPTPVRKYSSQWLDEAEAAHAQALSHLEAGNGDEALVLFALATSCASIAAASEARWSGYRARKGQGA